MDNLQPYKISLDFYIRKIITVNAKQLDSDSRVINITCTENGKKFFVDSSTTSAFVRYKKSDGHSVLNQVDILSDGTVNLELSQQMLAVEGRHLVDIMLINKSELEVYTSSISVEDDDNGNVTVIEKQTANVSDLNVEEILNAISENGIAVLSTMSFYINTEGVAIDGAEIESSYEYNALIEGLGKMVAVDNRMSTLEQAINENETQRQTNEQARQKAESLRVQAETKRQNDTQQAIKDCETATSNANKATINADNATKDAQTATSNANTATELANQATQNANDATANANNAAQEVRNVLNNSGMVLKTDIVHDLETEDANKVPDATQVKLLNEMIAKLQKQIDEMPEIHYGVVLDSAASHNAIFRGADLTNKYTVDQICERISSGTFEDLYIGDYFDITFTNPSGSEEQMRCILAAFDYYYHPDGYSGTNQHHALIVPKNCVSGYYTINTYYENYYSEKGFTKSTMFTTTLPSFVTPLQTALNNHIIQHRNYFVSALNADGASAAGAGMTGYASSWSNTATYLSLLSEVQVYGTQVWSSSPYNVGCDTGQLPLFAFDKTAKLAGAGGGVQDKGAQACYDYWWLRDLVSAHYFARVDTNGVAYYGNTIAGRGLRPLFLIG